MKKTWLIGCAGRAEDAKKAAEGGARECDAVELRLDWVHDYSHKRRY